MRGAREEQEGITRVEGSTSASRAREEYEREGITSVRRAREEIEGSTGARRA